MSINYEIEITDYLVFDHIITDVSYKASASHPDSPGVSYDVSGSGPVADMLIPAAEFEEHKHLFEERVILNFERMAPTLPMLLNSMYRAKNATPNTLRGLSEVKKEFHDKIDQAAEYCRLKYITPGSGQAMTYQQKVDEARKCLEDSDPTTEKYPMLAVELGITGTTLAEVAGVIIGMNDMWKIVGSQIELIRLSAKKAVTDATTLEQINTAYTSIVWP